MASSNCWKCLARPTTSITNGSLLPLSRNQPPMTAAAFSTSTILAYPPPAAKKRGVTLAVKGKRTLKIKKKAPPAKTGKPPASGERKALRKRIVLSNTNALEVAGMEDLDKTMLDEFVRVQKEGAGLSLGQAGLIESGSEERETWVGKVVGLSGETVDSLRAAEAFKTTQGWGLFRRPGLLIREESVELSSRLLTQKSGMRMIIDGDKGSGKSLMLLHAMATAFIKGWVVLNIPEAQELTTAANDYAPLPSTPLWTQPTYIATLLTRIHKANTTLLSTLPITLTHNLPIPLPSGTTLFRLCELGGRDPDIAWPIFQAFWAELMVKGRPPVLLCLDSVSHVMRDSLYRAPDMSFIHTHDLALVRHFVDYLSGTSKLSNGGAVLAATNRSHAPLSPSLQLATNNYLENQAIANGTSKDGQVTPRDPFEKNYDARADSALKSVEFMKLGGLSKGEARGLMEYWAQSGVLRSRVDEETVAEKWAVAGNGIVGEIQRGALWMRI